MKHLADEESKIMAAEVMRQLRVSEASLVLMLRAAGIDLFAPDQIPRPHTTALSDREIAILESGGAEWLKADSKSHQVRSKLTIDLVQQCQTLLEEALDSRSVAKLLQTSTEQIENHARENPAKLHGFEIEPKQWCFPIWQFTENGTIPCLSALLPLVENWTPIFLSRFMGLPNVGLEDDGKCLSPREWLIAGYDEQVVLHLAQFPIAD